MKNVELALLIRHRFLVRKKQTYFLKNKVLYFQNIGIRVLDGRITTLLEARAITLFAAETHIKSASWG